MNRRLLWSLTAVLTGVVLPLGVLQAAGKPFTFVAYGDSRDGNDVHRKLVARMRACTPKFTIGTGDFVDRGDNEPAWQTFADITAGLRKLAPYYPAKGNHDLERSGGTLYEKYLGMETNTEQLRYYSFNYGNAHFLVLDTNNLLSDEPQLQWLQEDLKATRGKFKHRFAVLHQPLFTLIPRRKEGSDRLCQKLQPIFTAAKLCGVFAGHDHYFYMTKRDGVTHITTGGGGAPLYDQDASLTQPGDKWGKYHHFLRVKVTSEQAQAEARDVEGKVLEKFTICSH